MTVLALPYSASPARVAGVVRRIPVTIGYLSLLALASWLLGQLNHDTRDSVLHHASTNLDNLGRLHVGTLLTSAFVMASAPTLAWWCGIAALLAGVELRLGSRRLAIAFLAGHVGATLLVAAGLATGVRAGWVDGGVSGTVDVGVSYGLMAVIGLLAATLPARLWPVWAGLWLTAAGVAVTEGRDFTSVGHLLALSIGLLAAARVRQRPRSVDGAGFGWTVAGGIAAGGALAWGSDLDGAGPVLTIATTVLAATLASLLASERRSSCRDGAGAGRQPRRTGRLPLVGPCRRGTGQRTAEGPEDASRDGRGVGYSDGIRSRSAIPPRTGDRGRGRGCGGRASW
jgi:hypothetical protein